MTLITRWRKYRLSGSARVQPHRPGSAAASFRASLGAGPGRACSLRVLEASSPGAGIVSPGFCGCRGALGRGGQRQSAPCSAPPPAALCSLPHCKMLANQDPGAGPRPSRPPSGLIESYIKKFSSERGERGEGEGKGGRREGKDQSTRGRKESLSL